MCGFSSLSLPQTVRQSCWKMSSQAASSSSATVSSARSRYLLQPNYPMAEPVFYVPQCPNITKVPEPRPARKAPVAGYDMKTLRKQIEHLQSVRHMPHR